MNTPRALRIVALLLCTALVAAACDLSGEVDTDPPDTGAVEDDDSTTAEPADTVAEGDPVEVTFIYSSAGHDPIRNESGNLLATYWEELGIQVNAEQMDFTALSQRLSAPPFEYDAFISGYVSRPERLDPDILLYRPFHSSGVDAGVNYQGYASERFDQVVEAQRTSTDPDERRDLVYEAQEILAEELPAIALYHVRDVHAYNHEVLSDVVPMMGQGLWNFWTINEATSDADDGFIRMGQEWDLDSQNPFAPTGGGNIEIFRLVYDMLARIGPDGEAVPWAAESWEQVDELTIDVTLRDGMEFHDGTPVTASDVKFSYERQRDGGADLYQPFLTMIESVDEVDDRNLRFNLSEPYPAIFIATFSQILILPEHIWGDVEHLPDFDNDEIVGSGPMVFDRWIPSEEIRTVANPDHFSAPNIEGLTHVVYGNPDAIFAGLEGGDIHMHDRRLLPAAIERARNSEHLSIEDIEDFGVYYMGFNMRQEPFDDHAFRQAIAHTIDYDTIVDTLLSGYGVPGQGFIAPANEGWHNPDVEYPRFDMDAARQILSDAGYGWNESGQLVAPNGTSD